MTKKQTKKHLPASPSDDNVRMNWVRRDPELRNMVKRPIHVPQIDKLLGTVTTD
jgi:hypothetical protein